MKKPAQEYRFKIDAFTPDTIPMARLAEYLADLAALLGHQHSVHFVRMEESSTVLVHSVEYEDVPKVQQRLTAVGAQEGPLDAMKAFAALDQKLAKDNAVGILQGYNDNDIIRFPGRERPEPFVYGPVRQQGSIDGVLIRIGGKDETVPVHLESENIVYQCNTSRQMASQLAHYLFGPVLRVHGSGRWQREEDGTWTMLRFSITHFEVLDDSPLTEAVKRLRAIEGSDWKTLEDPFKELEHLRREPDEIH